MNFRSPGAVAHRKRLAAERQGRIAKICELVAEGMTIKGAALELGISPNNGQSMFNEARAQLGWQAQ